MSDVLRPVIVLDFGGQYCHLIANRIRRLGCYSEIKLPETSAEALKKLNVAGIILSGGGGSVYEQDLKADPKILELGVPVLGICYGMQWLAYHTGGEVKPGKVKEYGKVDMELIGDGGDILNLGEKKLTVWMSHGDEVVSLPPDYIHIASSTGCKNIAMRHKTKPIWALQFHPEVTHTPRGFDILGRFLKHCTSASKWAVSNFMSHIEEEVRRSVGDRKVFILVSGGVDSTVAYALLQRVLGKDRVYGLVVDTGFMRKNEIADTQAALSKIGFANLHVEDASELFFNSLREVYEPEQKRKLIGQMFLDVKDKAATKLGCQSAEWVLGQGTIYPDTVETGGTKHSSKIKTHHNRVDAITQLIAEGRIVEPLKELYKDEVRALGKALSLPDPLIYRHPFPGPGLAVRILCAPEPAQPPSNTTALLDEIQRFCGKHFEVSILPVLSVGVQGDNRSYKHAAALFVPSFDVFAKGDDVTDRKHVEQELWRLANQLPNHFNTLNRVLVCLSHRHAPKQFAFAPHSYLTRERARALADADSVVESHMRRHQLYDAIWQFPVVLLPFGTAAGKESIVLRPVDSQDAMSANAFALPSDFISAVRHDLLSLPTIDTVFYDLTSKPPGTIEWE